MDTFHFTGHCGSFVYLNCNLVVYSASGRRRAMEEEEGVARVGLTKGPFIFRSDGEVARNFYKVNSRLIFYGID